MKKFLNALFNVFWVLLVGITSAISNFFLAVGYCITIIGIPFGLQYFKFIKLIFAPAGKIVVTKYSRHPIMNTLWLIFGGFVVATTYFLIASLLYITVVGIPLGKQLFKISRFHCAPFGCEILKDGEYSKKKNLVYDMKLLNRHICANPKIVIDNIRSQSQQVEELKEKKLKAFNASKIVLITTYILTILLGNIICSNINISSIVVFILIYLEFIFYILILRCVLKKKEWNFCEKYILPYISQYPEDSPLASKRAERLESLLKLAGLSCSIKKLIKNKSKREERKMLK